MVNAQKAPTGPETHDFRLWSDGAHAKIECFGAQY